MAKTWNADVAKNFKNIAALTADGWTTEDLEAVKTAPRSREANFENGKTIFPQVGGGNLLYSLWNEDEKKMYREYRKAGNSGSDTTRTRSSSASVDPEKLAMAKELGEYLAGLGVDEEHMEMFWKLAPHSVDAELVKLLGVENTFYLKPNYCNLRWVLNRKTADESFLENHFPQLEELSALWDTDEVYQCYKKQQVIDLARRLYKESNGEFDLNSVVDGLNATYDNC